MITMAVQKLAAIGWNDDSTASRCLSLVARHAPRLMLEGGGALTQEDRAHRKMTAAGRGEILRLRRAGKNLREIADATSWSPPVISGICRDAEMPFAAPRRLTDEVCEEIRRRRSRGERVADVAEALRVSPETVVRYGGKKILHGKN